jgi:hypothetical protein
MPQLSVVLSDLYILAHAPAPPRVQSFVQLQPIVIVVGRGIKLLIWPGGWQYQPSTHLNCCAAHHRVLYENAA